MEEEWEEKWWGTEPERGHANGKETDVAAWWSPKMRGWYGTGCSHDTCSVRSRSDAWYGAVWMTSICADWWWMQPVEVETWCVDYSQRETRVQRLMVLFSKTWISPGLPCRWHDLWMCSLHCVAATFLFLQTSLCSQKNNISSPSPSLKKSCPLNIFSSLIYMAASLSWEIFFFSFWRCMWIWEVWLAWRFPSCSPWKVRPGSLPKIHAAMWCFYLK